MRQLRFQCPQLALPRNWSWFSKCFLPGLKWFKQLNGLKLFFRRPPDCPPKMMTTDDDPWGPTEWLRSSSRSTRSAQDCRVRTQLRNPSGWKERRARRESCGSTDSHPGSARKKRKKTHHFHEASSIKQFNFLGSHIYEEYAHVQKLLQKTLL